MKSKFSCILLAFALFTVASKAQTKSPVMINANVLKLYKAGLGEDIILSRIESSTCKFDMSDDGMIALKKEGISDKIISAMYDKSQGRKKPVNDVTMEKPDKARSTASASSGIPEPEIINAVYLYIRELHSLKPLEKSNATQKLHKEKMGLGATTYTCEIKGEKSTIRLKAEEASSFAINTGGLPTADIVLFKVDAKKNIRAAVTSKIKGFGGNAMKGAQGVIACTVKMARAGIYELTPSTKLEPGEYFFTTKPFDYMTMANMDVFAFGID